MRTVGRTMRRDRPAVRQQLAGIFENYDTVTEQAPALLRVASDRVGRFAVR
jgi:hypothetical protein